ncbi:S41 family peptidase [Microbulbifer sp.]|uniref:S41 family peptidase n=1 Tax=Microbulbifer sp. TaxID=1908541 RepID=UPI003F33BD10
MDVFFRRLSLSTFFALSAFVLAACGGGGGSSDSNNFSSSSNSSSGSGTWEPGVFLPASTFASQCVNPRSGTNPETGAPYSDVQGTRLDENNWLRSMSNDLYLWYDEIEDKDPADFNDSIDYFKQLQTFALTPTGAEKDRFHFTEPTEDWVAQSQSGVSVGYGLEWALLERDPPNRRAVVAYTETEDGSGLPAVVTRGAEVLSVDGVVLANGDDVDTLNAGMWPSEKGERHTFELLPLGATDPVEITLVADAVTSEPVQHVKVIDGAMERRIGYMLFNDHIATAEPALVEAVNELRSEGIDELVLDIRYNGGGYLYIASQLAYMIAGDVPTEGQPFEQVIWNDKHPETDPVTGRPLTPAPFYNVTSDNSSLQADLPLPALDLPRVFVLTSGGTCSASESIMNSLRGVGVEVVQVGATTCGKPYGFYGLDNCGTTYFTIQFKGVNAKGYGDYTDGFFPDGSTGTDADLPGCRVGDDFTHLLGDENEARLAAAIHYIETGSCPEIPATAFARGAIGGSLSDTDARVLKSIWRSNRIMVR